MKFVVDIIDWSSNKNCPATNDEIVHFSTNTRATYEVSGNGQTSTDGRLVSNLRKKKLSRLTYGHRALGFDDSFVLQTNAGTTTGTKSNEPRS